jgi:hypothetical protein
VKHGLQHATIKMFKQNRAGLNPDWLFAACHQDHPSLTQRLLNIPFDGKKVCEKSTVALLNDKKQKAEDVRKPLIGDYNFDLGNNATSYDNEENGKGSKVEDMERGN